MPCFCFVASWKFSFCNRVVIFNKDLINLFTAITVHTPAQIIAIMDKIICILTLTLIYLIYNYIKNCTKILSFSASLLKVGHKYKHLNLLTTKKRIIISFFNKKIKIRVLENCHSEGFSCPI